MTFLVVGLGAAVMIRQWEQDHLEQKRTQVAEYLARNHVYAIKSYIERALTANYALAALVRQGAGAIPDFDAVATEMLPFYPGVSALELAPAGVVRQIVPLAENRQAIGHDLFKDPARTKEAFLARDTGKLTLDGPFNLLQGGLGAVGRLPVFLDDEHGRPVFWGFTSVVIRFPDVLVPARLDQLVERGFHYELWRIHPDTGEKQVIAASSNAALIEPVAAALAMPNGTWTLSVSPVAGWGDPAGLMLWAALGLAFSLLAAVLMYSLIRLIDALRETQHTLILRQEAEDALRKNQGFLQGVLDAVSSHIAVLDHAGVIVAVNAGWRRFSRENSPQPDQLAPHTDIGVNYLNVCGADALRIRESAVEAAKARDGIQAVIEGRLPTFSLEYPCHSPREHRWFMMTVTPLGGEEAGAVVVHTNITERKRYEQELQQAREAAEAANRAKSEFLAHMSHEIRTPLNGVLGLAQVLNREPLTANQRDMVERIQAAGQSLLAIINDILDLSKIEAGQLRLDLYAFELGTVVTNLTHLLGPTAQAKGLKLTVLAPPALLGWLRGDALRLEQVLINLVSNAIKFTERGEVAVRVQPQQTGETAVRLRFEVQDSGIGIAPEALARLFTPFTQAEEGITRRFGGTGLGLVISKRLVELMGGVIGVESQVGQGSTFWFELSVARTTEDELETLPAPAPAPPAGPRLRGVRVLVVDDSAMNREVVERVLKLEGAITSMAADGQQAVECLKARPDGFDAVLMDIQMPVMDGLTATRLIRSELGLTNLPIIALTASVLADKQQAAREAGMNGLLPKPLDLEQLVAEVRKWLPSPRPLAGEGAGVRAADFAAPPHPSPPPAGGREAVDDFPAIPGIDRARAAQTLGGDRAFFLRLLNGFVSEFADVVEQTHRDLAEDDREAAARRLHTLRGNAGNLGALDLMATAGELEEAIRRGETDLAAGLESLGRQLAALTAASAPWREAAVPSTPTPPLDAEQLEALRTALRQYDLKALRRFEALKPALAGALGAAKIGALDAAIHGLQFDEALDLLT